MHNIIIAKDYDDFNYVKCFDVLILAYKYVMMEWFKYNNREDV